MDLLSYAATPVGMIVTAIIFLLFLMPIFLIPIIVSFKRNHEYRWVILALCLTGPLTAGMTWIIAIIWALYPSNKTLIDPFVGNPTGRGYRNSGDTFGEAKYGFERGYFNEIKAKSSASQTPSTKTEIDLLERLHELKLKGIISSEEFNSKKQQLLERRN